MGSFYVRGEYHEKYLVAYRRCYAYNIRDCGLYTAEELGGLIEYLKGL